MFNDQYYLYKKAQDLTEKDWEFWENLSNEAKKRAKATGNHTNAYLRVGKNDYKFAVELCDKGFPLAVLLRQGFWKIEDYYFCPNSNKYALHTSGEYIQVKSFDDFLTSVLRD